MKQNYLNRQIQPEQLLNRQTPKVQNLAQAQSQAIATAQQHSGIPIQELVTEETYSDNNIHISVRHTKSTQTFHFEFQCPNSY